MVSRFTTLLPFIVACALFLPAQTHPAASTNTEQELRFVLMFSRHGIRAPLASEIRGNNYNSQAWPVWSVPAGVLTPHGTQALQLLGSYYRMHYSQLFDNHACSELGIYAFADTSQRTIASAHALLAGLAPGCSIEVHSSRSNTSGLPVDNTVVAAAILGRLGGQTSWWINANYEALEDLQRILSNCEGPGCDHSKPSIFDAPSGVFPASGNGHITIETPVSVGADFAEHFLLQYTEGFPMSQVGWGRVSRPMLNHLMTMNTGYHDFVQRTPLFAQVTKSDSAFRIDATLEQAASGKVVEGALGSPQNQFILIDGHDGDLASLGGLLQLVWLLPDQPFDATPPGSSLVFELYQDVATGEFTVEVSFVSQTLDQMRFLTPLTRESGPSSSPIFVPGCSQAKVGYPCSLGAFTKVIDDVIDTRYLNHSELP